jgi:predicted PurR-regulated permease PerM
VVLLILRWDKKFLHWGVTAFLVIAASIGFYMTILNWSAVKVRSTEIIGILSPVLWGFVLAYLLNPFACFFEQRVYGPLAVRIIKKEEKRETFARALGVLSAIIVSAICISFLLWAVLPQLYSSLVSVVMNMPEYINACIGWIHELLEANAELEAIILSQFGNISDVLMLRLNNLLPQFQTVAAYVTSGVFIFIRVLLNFLIGLIFSIYILLSKENFRTGCKKALYSIFQPRGVARFLSAVRRTHEAFSAFISGKLLESLIVGLICYIFCALTRMPYVPLVSVIIGITNIVPFFGPFIGAVPTTLIILMESPVKALAFVLFIIALQQVSASIISPRILSSTIGIGGFWIMFAIIVGGGLFGFVGMIVGIPIFSVIYLGLTNLVDWGLERKGLSTDRNDYIVSPSQRAEAKQPKKEESAPEGN